MLDYGPDIYHYLLFMLLGGEASHDCTSFLLVGASTLPAISLSNRSRGWGAMFERYDAIIGGAMVQVLKECLRSHTT